MGSIPTHGICVNPVLPYVQVAALRWADPSSKESYCLCKEDYGNEEEARAQERAGEPLINEWISGW
jgi:hypothetical protein